MLITTRRPYSRLLYSLALICYLALAIWHYASQILVLSNASETSDHALSIGSSPLPCLFMEGLQLTSSTMHLWNVGLHKATNSNAVRRPTSDPCTMKLRYYQISHRANVKSTEDSHCALVFGDEMPTCNWARQVLAAEGAHADLLPKLLMSCRYHKVGMCAHFLRGQHLGRKVAVPWPFPVVSTTALHPCTETPRHWYNLM